MSEALFDLIFRGEIAKNMDVEQARQNVQQLFKIPVNKVDALFCGKPVVLKRGLTVEAASKYRAVIKKAGALVDVVAQAPLAKRNTVSPVAPIVKASQVVANAREKEAEKETELSLSVAGSILGQKVSPAPDVAMPNFSIAAAGADVLNPSERAIEERVELDLSGYSVRGTDGLLLDPDEVHHDAEMDIDVDWSIAPVGSELLAADQRSQENVLELNLSGITLAEVGETLVESKPDMSVAPDVGHLSLKT